MEEMDNDPITEHFSPSSKANLKVVPIDGKKERSPISEDLPIALSDDHLAEAFASRYQQQFRYVHKLYKWKIWDTTADRWRDDDTHQSMTAARALCRAAATWPEASAMTHLSKTKLDSHGTAGKILSFATTDPRLATVPDQWDADNWLLGTPKGVYDLRTGQHRQGAREDYISLSTAVAPQPGKPVEWLKYLHATHRGNNDVISFLQRFLGYALTGDVTEHALVFAFGQGRNGKGVMLDTIIYILADYGLAAPISVFAQQKFQQHSTEIAQLRGKRFVTSEEPGGGMRWDEGKVKWLTGGGAITARRMRQDDITFQPTWKLFFAGNAIPQLSKVDEAIRARFNVVPFTRTFALEERDPLLREKLKAEAPQILQWLMEGCAQWRKTGLQVPAVCRAATDEYLVSEDTLGQFIEEECTLVAGAYEQAPALYNAYKAWAERMSDEPISLRAFATDMMTRPNIRRVRVATGYRFVGVSLRQ